MAQEPCIFLLVKKAKNKKGKINDEHEALKPTDRFNYITHSRKTAPPSSSGPRTGWPFFCMFHIVPSCSIIVALFATYPVNFDEFCRVMYNDVYHYHFELEHFDRRNILQGINWWPGPGAFANCAQCSVGRDRMVRTVGAPQSMMCAGAAFISSL